MPRNRESLLAGRNVRPLDDADVRRVINTFIGLDNNVPVRFEEGRRTVFRVAREGDETVAEIVVGEDIYPGTSVADPNSSLSMSAAAAHELCHYYRWQDKTEVEDLELEEIDEALTSLEAIQRFPRDLKEHEVRQLVADAIQRLQLFVQKNVAAPPEGEA